MNLKALVILALLATACGAVAQERMARVGYLSWKDSGPFHELTSKAFIEGLREEGYVEGKNLTIVRGSADFDPGRFSPLARGMSKAGVDVYFAAATPMAEAAWRADRKTPIVIANILDPEQFVFVDTLAQPGHNVTGVTTMNKELNAKRLQLLAEAVPGIRRVGVVIDEAMRGACTQEVDNMNQAAQSLGLRLIYTHVDRATAVDGAFRRLAAGGAQAVLTTLTSTRNGLEKDFADATLKYRLPSMHEMNYGAQMGGLISYGPDFGDVFRRAGRYAGRILKGAKPAEMPIEQPSRFLLTINRKTAAALGITLSQAILLRADQVIE